MRKLIGLSFPYCLVHMARGKINPNDVLAIISDSIFTDEEEMRAYFRLLKSEYWPEPEIAAKVYGLIHLFWYSGRIHQNRLYGDVILHPSILDCWTYIDLPNPHDIIEINVNEDETINIIVYAKTKPYDIDKSLGEQK
jgi:hypothetical protein